MLEIHHRKESNSNKVCESKPSYLCTMLQKGGDDMHKTGNEFCQDVSSDVDDVNSCQGLMNEIMDSYILMVTPC